MTPVPPARNTRMRRNLRGQRDYLARGPRPPEEIALAEARALADEVLELVGALDPLRQVVDAQAARQMDDRRRHRRGRLVLWHLSHERAVDLEQVHGHPPEAGERGMARAEVVDRHPEAVFVERLEHRL